MRLAKRDPSLPQYGCPRVADASTEGPEETARLGNGVQPEKDDEEKVEVNRASLLRATGLYCLEARFRELAV